MLWMMLWLNSGLKKKKDEKPSFDQHVDTYDIFFFQNLRNPNMFFLSICCIRSQFTKYSGKTVSLLKDVKVNLMLFFFFDCYVPE